MRKYIIPALAAFDAAGVYAVHAIPAAAQARGYWAVGGEYLLIPVLAFAGWYLGECIVKWCKL